MRGKYLYIIILLFMVFVLTACSSKKSSEIEHRAYVMTESEEPIKPTVILSDDNKFSFSYSPLSSYIAIGTYEIDDSNIILKTDDGLYKYVFKIEDGALIFNANESSSIPSYAEVPDGAIFE
ncbi:hypothetical protein DFR55_14817 [Herbinix hemicellulosilytica]|uniref:Putative membrane protein n=1 Tax=Herbinix hemicellulosilytica TaxID=1564487 RepID=A0A0H5SIW8_HERHM|nr:hypothetical protein [Herbinix hemicellulosilytica]RBP56421.1 hypothetical protein DFR55_14817 [Herbinix hemicellulosilytica]CRZ35444.1 putative membrane protein [Herbinix hemicellulosilytica]